MVWTGELDIQEAARLVQAIQRDPESHVAAAFLEWSYVPTSAERAQWDIFELEINTRRKRGQVYIRLDRPWQKKKATAEVREVSADSPERAEAHARLKAHS